MPVFKWVSGSETLERVFVDESLVLVALNFQTGDLSMSLNHARFLDNKQCGYILKPAILRDSKPCDLLG